MIIKHLVKHVSYPVISWYNGHGDLYRHLRELEKQQYFPTQRLLELQWLKLKGMLHYAYEHTEYYRRRFDEYGIKPFDIKDFSDMVRVPLLTKDDIERNRERMVSDEYPRQKLVPSYSGGTSGKMVHFYYAKDCLAYKQAATIRCERWTGWDIGGKTLFIWPASQDYHHEVSVKMKLKNVLSTRMTMCPAASLDEQTIRRHIETIAKTSPDLIRGFPSPLTLIADYIIQNGLDSPSTCHIVSTGEPLFRARREKIETAFGAQVYDSYGAREVSLIGQECELHNGYHINMECNHLEFVRDGKHARPGEVADMVVTDLVNRGMPLIRYAIDDQGIASERTCACGRGLTLFEGIVGRDNDVLRSVTGAGVLPSALIMFMIEEGPEMSKMKIVQDRADHLRILLSGPPVPGESHFAYYRKVIYELFGHGMRFDFEVLDDIPNERSGKFRFTKFEADA